MLLSSLFSVCIGLVLLNSAIVINVRAFRIGWAGTLPIEVRYAALFALILLIGLNSNQWMAGNLLFPMLAIALITSVLISVGRLSDCERRDALRDGLSLMAVQTLTLLAVFVAFEMHRFWLLEAPNHDSLIYYQGLHWAKESPLFTAKEMVRARWGLGVCGEGASWIGYDCSLYRGGSYTIAAWAQYFSPHITGNGLYYIVAYAATIAWFACRMTSTVIGRGSSLRAGLLTLAVALSTGIMGALFNSNMATVMGAASLALIVALALRTDIQPLVRFSLMATWSAVAAHVYAESVFYAGLLISLIFLVELPRHLPRLHLVGIFRLGALLLLIVFGFGNIAVCQAFTSLFMFDEIVKSGAWFSWYIHQPTWLWSGSFIAGLLMNSRTSASVVMVATVITLTAAVVLLYSRQTRSGALALIGTSLLAVIYIEVTGYQYGEHKVIHLLGPAWALALVAAASRLLDWNGTAKLGRRPLQLVAKTMGIVILLCLMLTSTSFYASAISLLKQMRGPHGLDFGLTNLATYVRPGDTVLVDDNAWIKFEKFQKTHYLIFQLHNQGAEVLLPNITSDQLRGGYFRAIRNDTLRRANGVDWLVQSRGHLLESSRFVPPDAVPVWENADYRLYRIGKKPVAVAGNGWYDCERTHCWTVAPFEIETYVPQIGKFELSLNFGIFSPPEGGTITVRDGDGRLLATFRSPSEQMQIELPQGWSRLVFKSDWTATSPLQAGVSADPRQLFAAIKRVEINPSYGQAGK